MDDLRDFIDPDEGYIARKQRSRSRLWRIKPKREATMPELASQSEIQALATLSAWYLYEWNFFNLLAEAGFSMLDIELCMTMEAA